MSSTIAEKRKLYNDFLNKFPYESLNSMTLEKYTNLNKSDSFCYWIERKTYELGSVLGGSSSKFVIYEYLKKPIKDGGTIQLDNRYAWYRKLNVGTAIEAFNIVKLEICKIAEFARNKRFDQIDNLKLFGDVCKWKIAFLYSNEQLIPIYNKQMLQELAQYYGLVENTNKSISELQAFLLSVKGNKDIYEFYEELLKILESKQSSTPQTWLYLPGEKAAKWADCIEQSIMCIAWDDLGDLLQYSSREELKKAINKAYNKKGDSKNDTSANWDFVYKIQIGDIVFAKYGAHRIIGRGTIVGEYIYDDNREQFKHIRQVKWDKIGNWTMEAQLPLKTLTDITPYKDYVEKLNKLVESETSEVYSLQNSSKCYWWLNANPKIWSMNDWKVGEEQNYTLYNFNGNKRRIFQNFLDAKTGDIVVCYESNPTKQILGLAEISKSNDGKNIYIKKLESFVNPINYAEFKEIEELKGMEFLVNPNGSFFKLTEIEYTVIMDLIREFNPAPTYESKQKERYSKEDFIREVFMDSDSYDKLVYTLQNKKNIVLQGAPGVGKTFCAKRLAYSMMGEKNEERICFVQFHQNYSYEDFIMGYKPEEDSFKLKKGIFYDFCTKAKNDTNPNNKYFFIIDEINRGNLSKIFGELLMLIEKDYRDTRITLSYSGENFYVPSNLYIIGMMNTADRSLALIDYALRRRFSFVSIEPGFDSKGFEKYKHQLQSTKYNNLIECIKDLNKDIENDASLGKGFVIGHSYFCYDRQGDVNELWLDSIVKYDIIPTLEEYWFDDSSKVNEWKNKLEAAIK